jgi:putative transcriptional regulator
LKTVLIKSHIKELRARYDLTQDQLAEMVDVRRETIVHIEHNRYNPSLTLAYLIAKALRSTIEEIFVFEEK